MKYPDPRATHSYMLSMYPSISTCPCYPFMEWSRKEKINEKKSSAAASSTATAAAGAASTAAADSASISRMRFYIFCMAAKNGSCSSRKRCGKEAFLRSPGDGQTCSSVRPSFFQTRPGFPLVLRLLLVLHMMLLSLLSLLQIRAPHPPCDYSCCCCCCCCCCSIDMWHHFLTSTRTHTYVCLSMHARTL